MGREGLLIQKAIEDSKRGRLRKKKEKFDKEHPGHSSLRKPSVRGGEVIGNGKKKYDREERRTFREKVKRLTGRSFKDFMDEEEGEDPDDGL